jgi:2-oxoglutarate ferredoxin oxidoreductase subunit beta
MHDGGLVRLHKIDPAYDPSDKVAAMAYLEAHRARGEVVTGLLYVDPDSRDMHAALSTADMPLNALGDADLVPGNAALAAVNAALR